MKYEITKSFLEECLIKGMTNREIAEHIGCCKSNIGHFITQYGLNDLQKKHKNPSYKIKKIDSHCKAYLIGFIACDAAISNSMIELSVEKVDKEILYFLANEIKGNVFIDDTFDKKHRQFPRARCSKKIPDIKIFVGGDKKENRHLPIVKSELNRYLLLGTFDADGCITWGRRKDKNRIWQKVSFTTSLNIAVCIQNILLKELNISTVVRPKSGNEKCYVLEFSNRKDVLKFLDYIYQDDFVILRRKYLKAKALRLELEENGEGTFK